MILTAAALAAAPQTGLLPLADRPGLEVRADTLGFTRHGPGGLHPLPRAALGTRAAVGPVQLGATMVRPLELGATTWAGSAQLLLVDTPRFTFAPWVFGTWSVADRHARKPTWELLATPTHAFGLSAGATFAWHTRGVSVRLNARAPVLSESWATELIDPRRLFESELHVDIDLTALALRPNPRATDTIRISARRLRENGNEPFDLFDPGLDFAMRHARRGGAYVEARVSVGAGGPGAGLALGWAR